MKILQTRISQRYTRIKYKRLDGTIITRSFFNDNPNSQEIAPMATAKQLILDTVDELNKLGIFEKPLRLKSKTLQVIVQTLNAQLAAVDTDKFWENVNEDIIDVLETNGIDLPPEQEQDMATEGEGEEEGVNPEFKETKEDKKAAKKAKKAAKKAIKAGKERLAKMEALQAISKDKSLPKKERKQAKKQLKELKGQSQSQEDTSEDTSSVKTNKSKATTAGPTKGPEARANRTIPDTISWPKSTTITAKIIKLTAEKPMTVDKIIKRVSKAFPERPVSGLTKTITALVGGKGIPLPLSWQKGMLFEVENDGTPEKTVKCISELPEDYTT